MLPRILLVLVSCFLLLAACTDKSPKDALLTCATALEMNDSSAFLAQFDLKMCATHQIKNMTEANDALSTLDRLGRTLGIGGMEDLLGNVFDMERSLRQNLGRKASTGELMQECARTETTGCPWVPQSLRQADVRVINQKAAVARVVSPCKYTTWLALAKRGENWLIVGWADLEDLARKYATSNETIPDRIPDRRRPTQEKNGTTI